jgi:hypothetical protein
MYTIADMTYELEPPSSRHVLLRVSQWQVR